MKLSEKKDFSILFDKHYKRLFNYSFKIVRQKDLSEDLVQETFIKLWENIKQIKSINRSIEGFLMITLKNKIIDYHRKNQSRNKHINLYTLNNNSQTEIDNEWELLREIDCVYSSLSLKTIEIFQLSRDKGLTYKEIASLKNISVKTVELHISKALKAFKKGLKEYL